MNLNIPLTRQQEIGARLAAGGQIVASDIAAEFGVSVDTVRRDILALEHAGQARRVRGGAVPISPPVAPLYQRLPEATQDYGPIVRAAVRAVAGDATLLLDGGATVLALARALSPRPGLLVVTPSPRVAIACEERGIAVFMIGGRLSVAGGVNVGDLALDRLNRIAADVAVLGACGLDADFGLSSDDPDEAGLKAAMHAAATRTLVLADASKLGLRARYRTLRLDHINTIITDADTALATRHLSGAEVICV